MPFHTIPHCSGTGQVFQAFHSVPPLRSTVEHLPLLQMHCILDTGTLQTPMLSCLKLHDCDISWESPLLKGLKYLDIRMSKTQRPLFSVEMDGFHELPQLEMLILHSSYPKYDWPVSSPLF